MKSRSATPRGASPCGSRHLRLSHTGRCNPLPLLLPAGARWRSSSAGAFPPSMSRRLSKARVRGAAPTPSLVSPGAPVQSDRVWGPGLQPRRGGPDPVTILFWFGRAAGRARGSFLATSSPQLGPQEVGNPLERLRQRR
ncbi:hypothetical protein NDU88_000224 [Pleurodeles waltl]|uniref:Uncharacterized protein n=1 Tax=Pleurodeles waltl TaxID=8319 RepID=A0AAV7TEC3_PLEWA|nr:hypothetical protein NDU88_000224 [Pleurodeles waltl]